jgi:hypothetical protein
MRAIFECNGGALLFAFEELFKELPIMFRDSNFVFLHFIASK